MFTITIALLGELTLSQPDCPAPETWLDRSLPVADRGWATDAEKKRTRARMSRTWRAMGFDDDAVTALLTIVKRESFNGDTCAVHVLGENEYGLGAGGLFVRLQKPKWDRDAPDWVLYVPEVQAVIMGRMLRRSLGYGPSETAKPRTWLRFQQVYAGRVRHGNQHVALDNRWCHRLKSAGVDCHAQIGNVGEKLGTGPSEDQTAFVLALQTEIET